MAKDNTRKNAESLVKTVVSNAPDNNGNVNVTASDIGAYSKSETNSLVDTQKVRIDSMEGKFQYESHYVADGLNTEIDGNFGGDTDIGILEVTMHAVTTPVSCTLNFSVELQNVSADFPNDSGVNINLRTFKDRLLSSLWFSNIVGSYGAMSTGWASGDGVDATPIPLRTTMHSDGTLVLNNSDCNNIYATASGNSTTLNGCTVTGSITFPVS